MAAQHGAGKSTLPATRALPPKVRFATDSSLEGGGFEPSVPRKRDSVFRKSVEIAFQSSLNCSRFWTHRRRRLSSSTHSEIAGSHVYNSISKMGRRSAVTSSMPSTKARFVVAQPAPLVKISRGVRCASHRYLNMDDLREHKKEALRSAAAPMRVGGRFRFHRKKPIAIAARASSRGSRRHRVERKEALVKHRLLCRRGAGDKPGS
jgi:hypothetical protein